MENFLDFFVDLIVRRYLASCQSASDTARSHLYIEQHGSNKPGMVASPIEQAIVVPLKSSRGSGTYKIMLQLVLQLGAASISAVVIVFAAKYLMKYLDPDNERRERAAKAREELFLRIGRTGVETSEHEDLIAKDAVNPSSIDVTFDDIGGLDEEKQRLREIVVLPFTRPDLFSRGRLLRPPKGVLLYGPPGTGKTMLAKAIARETSAVFLNISLSTLQDKWFGESQKLVRAVFTLAWKIQPCIIFIDEIDSFLRERKDSDHESSGNMKAEFMTLWDGLASDNDAQVVVVGATNRPWAIDKAILRRLPRPFLIDVPDVAQRKLQAALGSVTIFVVRVVGEGQEILRKLLREEVLEEGFDLDMLAQQTTGYSGSDLKELCRAALLMPVQEFIQQETQQIPKPGGGGGDSAGRSATSGKANSAVAVAVNKPVLRPLRASDVLYARRMVSATGVEADEYFRRSTGMSKDDFVRFMNG